MPRGRGAVIAILVVAALAVVGGVFGAIALAQHVERQAVIAETRASTGELTDALSDQEHRRRDLTRVLEYATIRHDGLSTLLAEAGTDTVVARLGTEQARALSDAIGALGDELRRIATAESAASTVTLLLVKDASLADNVDESVSTDELREDLERIRAAIRAVLDETAQVRGDIIDVKDAVSGLDDAIAALRDSVPAVVGALLATNPSATADSGRGLEDAAEAVTGLNPRDIAIVDALRAYFAAAEAVESSHQTEEARRAAETEATAGGGQNSGTPGRLPGGGGGGGSTPLPADQNRYVGTNSHYVDWATCNAAGAASHSKHDPGPGGTSRPSFTTAWSYQNRGTYIDFYVCFT